MPLPPRPSLRGARISRSFVPASEPYPISPRRARPSSSPLSYALTQPTVTIGGVSGPILSYAGLGQFTPVGLYQVNVLVPTGVIPGNAVPVVLNIGGVVSNTVTIAVQ